MRKNGENLVAHATHIYNVGRITCKLLIVATGNRLKKLFKKSVHFGF